MRRFRLPRYVPFTLALVACIALPLGCGGSSSSTATPTPGPGGMGMGPSGTTCTTSTNCFSMPAGTMAMPCPASVGANVAVNLGPDRDYVLAKLNAIRTTLGLTPFTTTTALNDFAQAASNDLLGGGGPHAYFIANAAGSPAFTGGRAENQTAPSWTTNTTSTQVDEIIACFMSEEHDPAGFQKGHWEAIVCPCFQRIGIGLVKNGGGELFLTIDFSE